MNLAKWHNTYTFPIKISKNVSIQSKYPIFIKHIILITQFSFKLSIYNLHFEKNDELWKIFKKNNLLIIQPSKKEENSMIHLLNYFTTVIILFQIGNTVKKNFPFSKVFLNLDITLKYNQNKANIDFKNKNITSSLDFFWCVIKICVCKFLYHFRNINNKQTSGTWHLIIFFDME